jgi:hypothetical protein
MDDNIRFEAWQPKKEEKDAHQSSPFRTPW